MPYPIEDKIVIAIASSALFDLSESDAVFRREGEDAYRAWMYERRDMPLWPGIAFPFVRRFLALNEGYQAGEGPAEVVLLSKNDPEAGLRVFASIRTAGLDIVRAAFLDGRSPAPYLGAFNACLFLSADPADVVAAIEAGLPAGRVLGPGGPGLADDSAAPGEELRIAFDFDGVLADDEAERIYRSAGGLAAFSASEAGNAGKPLDPGPLKEFFSKLAALQAREGRSARIRTAIITARNAPAHERVVTTLASWGIRADETFFLGGIEKRRILEVFRPHLFFDDQISHLAGAWGSAACVHVPFGVANKPA